MRLTRDKRDAAYTAFQTAEHEAGALEAHLKELKERRSNITQRCDGADLDSNEINSRLQNSSIHEVC
jgi:hypothetical protein